MPDCSPDEFVSLYLEHERRLYRYVASLLSHPSAVEDVLQETAKVLWQTFAEYRREDPFLPWACRIAYNRVLSHSRRERTQRGIFDLPYSRRSPMLAWSTTSCSKPARAGWRSVSRSSARPSVV